MPLTARHADWWNGVGLHRTAFRERSGLLDRLRREQGRAPGEVRRTMVRTVHYGADLAAVERRVAGKLRADLADKPFEQVLETLLGEERALIGTPDMSIEQIRADGAAGAEELMLQWFTSTTSRGCAPSPPASCPTSANLSSHPPHRRAPYDHLLDTDRIGIGAPGAGVCACPDRAMYPDTAGRGRGGFVPARSLRRTSLQAPTTPRCESHAWQVPSASAARYPWGGIVPGARSFLSAWPYQAPLRRYRSARGAASMPN